MALIEVSVGTVSRDYSTISAAEADADNAAVVSAGDDYSAQPYNDSAFDEGVVMNGGATIGLNSFEINVPQAERHDGTAGIGARIVASTSRSFFIQTPAGFNEKYSLRGLEIDQNGQNGPSIEGNNQEAGNIGSIEHCLIHAQSGGGSLNGFVRANTRDLRMLRLICYDNKRSTGGEVRGLSVDGDRASGGVFNCTVWNVLNQGAGDAHGIHAQTNDLDGKYKNNISMGAAVSGAGATLSFRFTGTNPDSLNNMSDDDSADDAGGTGHLISQSNATQFVSTVLGSEDLHLLTGSDARGAGGVITGIANSDTDIDGVAVVAPWDIGADQFAGGGGPTTDVRRHIIPAYMRTA